MKNYECEQCKGKAKILTDYQGEWVWCSACAYEIRLDEYERKHAKVTN